MSGYGFSFKSNIRRKEAEEYDVKNNFPAPKQIARDEFNQIMEDLMEDKHFQQLYEDAAGLANRLTMATEELRTKGQELADWQTKKEAYPGIVKLAQNGRKLSEIDTEILNLKLEGLEEIIEATKQKEDKAAQEKDKLKDRVWAAQLDMKKYCLLEMGKTFCYEKDEKFFKILNGSLKLTQKKSRSLDEMGFEFRCFLLEDDGLRKITFDGIIKILRRYHSACGIEMQDKHTIMELLNFVRDNPKMTRLEFAEEAKAGFRRQNNR